LLSKKQKGRIMPLTNNNGKTGRAGSPLPAECMGCQAAARTEWRALPALFVNEKIVPAFDFNFLLSEFQF
jgi:hypothetical protein